MLVTLLQGADDKVVTVASTYSPAGTKTDIAPVLSLIGEPALPSEQMHNMLATPESTRIKTGSEQDQDLATAGVQGHRPSRSKQRQNTPAQSPPPAPRGLFACCAGKSSNHVAP